MLQNFKIFIVGLLTVFSFYFFFELPFNFDFLEIPIVEADTATTTLQVQNSAPTVSGALLNLGSDVNLVENSATTVTATCTVSDTNSYADISSVIARVYRSGVTSSENCTLDDNNCYQQTSCATSSCSGSDCTATCQFSIWFIAEPTDAGSDWDSQHWVAWIKAIDASNASSSATNSAQIIEMNTLNALDVSDSVGYGSLTPGQTNDPLDKSVKATTTGNSAIDANISGTDMCTDYATCAANTVAIGQQHYATSGVVYASGYTASSTAARLEFGTAKPTATTSNQVQDIYWGISVPASQAIGSYTGVNTFAVLSD